MKETINNALNEINDKHIEEAYHADRLQNTTARTVRNIAIPVASVAAVTALCLGLGKLGVFKSGGVDLLPESTTNGAGDTSSIIINDPQYEYIGYTPVLPDTMPVVLQTSEHIESIVFGSEYPEMIYADEDSAMFTDGISGLYIFDFDTEQISFAADIYSTFDLALNDFPEKIGTNYGGDSWSGIELFAGADGTPYCSMAYHSDVILTGSGLPTQNQWETKYYEIDTEMLTLTAIPSEDITKPLRPLYTGLKEIPYSENNAYRNMSLKAAYIDDTDEFVYIRNCTTDIDLLPRYNMEYIELRRWTAEEVTGEPMEGGYYPFSDKVGKDAVVYANYYTGEDVVGHECHGFNFNGATFTMDMYASAGRVPEGYYTIYGDIVSLTEKTNGYQWLYRIDGNTLIPLEAIIAQPENADLEETYHGKMLHDQTGVIADDILPQHYDALIRQQEAIIAALNTQIEDIDDHKESLQAQYDTITAILADNKKLTDEERQQYYTNLASLDMAISYMDTDRRELEAMLADVEEELEQVKANMKLAGSVSSEVQNFLSSLDPRVAAAVKGFIPAAPDDLFWYISGEEEPHGIVTAYAIRMLNKSVSVMDDDEAEALLSDDQLVYTMCLDSYWIKDDGNETVASDYAYQVDELDKALTDMILSSELSYSGSADMENMLYPLDPKYNYVTSYFGYDSFRVGAHYGIDIADEGIGGADIYAAQDGVVILTYKDSGWNGGFGNYVIIDHGNGYCTIYAHCYEVYVSAGDEVKRGDVIAAVGTTGWSTGNHLHFEVRKDGVAIDPLSFPYGDVIPIKYDSFESTLQHVFENVGEPAIPDYIAMPIGSNGNTVYSTVYDEYTEYRSYAHADVYAADKGEIVFAGYVNEKDKICIAIMHEGYMTVYRNLSSYTFEMGEYVHMGWTIGKADAEGRMFFELRTDADVIMNTGSYCDKIDSAMNEMPQSGNAKAAFCDQVLMINEPENLFAYYDGTLLAYAITTTDGDVFILREEDGSAAKHGNMFFQGEESLVDVTYTGEGYLITTVTENKKGSYLRKEYYLLENKMIDKTLTYRVYADGSEAVIASTKIDYLFTEEEVQAYEYDPAT